MQHILSRSIPPCSDGKYHVEQSQGPARVLSIQDSFREESDVAYDFAEGYNTGVGRRPPSRAWTSFPLHPRSGAALEDRSLFLPQQFVGSSSRSDSRALSLRPARVERANMIVGKTNEMAALCGGGEHVYRGTYEPGIESTPSAPRTVSSMEEVTSTEDILREGCRWHDVKPDDGNDFVEFGCDEDTDTLELFADPCSPRPSMKPMLTNPRLAAPVSPLVQPVSSSGPERFPPGQHKSWDGPTGRGPSPPRLFNRVSLGEQRAYSGPAKVGANVHNSGVAWSEEGPVKTSIFDEVGMVSPCVAGALHVPTAAKRRQPEVLTFLEPTPLDVKLGRGRVISQHYGNKKFHEVKEELFPLFKAATKKEKHRYADALVAAVHRWGGRFLDVDKATGCWYEVHDRLARIKATQALQDAKKSPEERLEKQRRYRRERKARAQQQQQEEEQQRRREMRLSVEDGIWTVGN